MRLRLGYGCGNKGAKDSWCYRDWSDLSLHRHFVKYVPQRFVSTLALNSFRRPENHTFRKYMQCVRTYLICNEDYH